LIVVTGVDETAMDSALMSLSWDLANAVVVRHRIDPMHQVLSRVVSDSTGVIEQCSIGGCSNPFPVSFDLDGRARIQYLVRDDFASGFEAPSSCRARECWRCAGATRV
jgi:hypothetical protein